MTKKDFLKRCETLWNLNIAFEPFGYNRGAMWQDRKVSRALVNATDTYLRLRDVFSRHPEWFVRIQQDMQGKSAIESLTDFAVFPDGTNKFKLKYTLAGDINAYAAVRVAAVLDHPCQLCAEDPREWHTRYGFCNHNKAELLRHENSPKKKTKKSSNKEA